MKRLFLFLTIALGFVAQARAGEIIYGWNRQQSNESIWDMKFMPDNDYFIIVSDSTLEIRATDTGDSVISYRKPAGHHNALDFTSDSSKFVLINGPKIELRNTTDMSIIAQDSIVKEYPDFVRDFYRLAVDPVRNLAYCIVGDFGNLEDERIQKRKIVVYDYNTMTQQAVLPGSEDEFWEIMAISKDGKYLAAITNLKSKLVVWSLESMQMIREFWLIDPYSYTKFVITSQGCIKFSETNTDYIYYSGTFPQTASDINHDGLFVYSIDSNRIIDSTFGVGEKRLAMSRFCFFDNGKKLLNVNQSDITVLGLLKNEIEYQKTQENDGILRVFYALNSKKSNRFIAYHGTYLKEFQYDPYIGVNENDTTIQNVYPNPTTNSISISLNCTSPNLYYEVLNANGEFLASQQAIENVATSVRIDFSAYPAGAYFVRIGCGNETKTYKVVKI